MRTIRNSFSVLSLSAATVLAGCAGPSGLSLGGATTKFTINRVVNQDTTHGYNVGARFTVGSACPAGQTLIGGSYATINAGSTDPNLIVVEGSYPAKSSGSAVYNQWNVQFRNPDNPGFYSGDSNTNVAVIAYCAVAPGLDLTQDVRQVTGSPGRDAITAFQIEDRCATSDEVVTSGGFLTTGLGSFRSPGGDLIKIFFPGLEGTGIQGTGPLLHDSSNAPMGWFVNQLYAPAFDNTSPQIEVSTTVYAMCFKGLAGKSVARLASSSAVVTKTETPLSTGCNAGEFAVGGGYRIAPAVDELTTNSVVGGSAVDTSTDIFSATLANGWKLSANAYFAGRITIENDALCVSIPII